jgi:hypothetical protein
MTIEALKAAIAHLPAEEMTVPAAWIVEQDMQSWDEQIDKDFSSGGKGMAILDEMKADIRTERHRATRPREDRAEKRRRDCLRAVPDYVHLKRVSANQPHSQNHDDHHQNPD